MLKKFFNVLKQGIMITTQTILIIIIVFLILLVEVIIAFLIGKTSELLFCIITIIFILFDVGIFVGIVEDALAKKEEHEVQDKMKEILEEDDEESEDEEDKSE